MYGVAQAVVTIPASYQRLKKLGYCADMQMRDVWRLTLPKTPEEITSAKASDTVLPVVLLSRIYDDIQP